MKKLLTLGLSILAISFISCSEDDDVNQDHNMQHQKGKITLMFENFMKDVNGNTSPVKLNQQYVTDNGDTLRFNTLKYFISNVKLINENGDTTTLENSYHLIESTDMMAMTSIDLEVPHDTYKYISFGLGVDSRANLDETVIEGDLSPSSNMIWNWNIGYKFINLEGSYSGDSKGAFVYHLGKNENYQVFDQKFPRALTINDDMEAMAHFMVNFNQFFNGPNAIDVDATNKVKAMPESDVKNLIENTQNGFVMIHHVENGEDDHGHHENHDEGDHADHM